MIKIKDFSTETEFSIRMLRYLEEVKVLIPERDTNNYRVYTKEQITEAIWIKKLQNLGIQLKEIEILKSANSKKHLEILNNVLEREQEIAEIKSETIPVLKAMVDFLATKNTTIQEYYKIQNPIKRKMKTVGEDDKFHRTAYNIPILRNIYEDHLTTDASIELIATDLLKFKEWYESSKNISDVFSVLNDSSFVLGENINNNFIIGYELSWNKFLPAMNFKRLEDFSKEDISQLMGPHDIIIRTTFKYKDSDIEGEIVIPYAPIYTMSQLSNKI